MQTVIFCGGKGTRISGSGPEKKELFEIGTRPILWHVMKIFATYGHKEFILPLGDRGDLIRRYFIEYERLTRDLCLHLGRPDQAVCQGENEESDWQIIMADTGQQMPDGQEVVKGERLRRIARYVAGERFFLTYGDGLGDVDLDALLRFHCAHGRWVTVTGYQPFNSYGIVQAGVDGLVTDYLQYPRMEHWINAGFFVVERPVLAMLSPGQDWETGMLVQLARQGQLMMYRHPGFWIKMDTLKEAQRLNEIWASGQAPWKIW